MKIFAYMVIGQKGSESSIKYILSAVKAASKDEVKGFAYTNYMGAFPSHSILAIEVIEASLTPDEITPKPHFIDPGCALDLNEKLK